MEPSLFFLVVAVLATGQIIEIWHHSELLAGCRERVKLWNNFWSDMLACPFCLSNWVALVCLGSLCWLGNIALLVLSAFAVARLSNLVSDLSHGFCRTHRGIDIPQNEITNPHL